MRPVARLTIVVVHRRSRGGIVITDPAQSSGAAALVGVDWGTSNVRVMQLDRDGRVLAVRGDPRGAAELSPGDFLPVLESVAGDWLDEADVLVCGMAGARGRWREAGYAPCPASVHDIARGLVQPDPDRRIFIVPGVARIETDGLADVMRGEETQVMGVWGGGGGGWAIAPGTHSKWIRVEDGRLKTFRTFVTGELFAALGRSAILSTDPEHAAGDDEAFLSGVERGLSDRAVTAALFSVRVGILADRLSSKAAPDYLSGLLIGAEIAAQPAEAMGQRLAIIGTPDLTRRYTMALDTAGQSDVEAAPAEEVTAKGLWRIWESRA